MLAAVKNHHKALLLAALSQRFVLLHAGFFRLLLELLSQLFLLALLQSLQARVTSIVFV